MKTIKTVKYSLLFLSHFLVLLAVFLIYQERMQLQNGNRNPASEEINPSRIPLN